MQHPVARNAAALYGSQAAKFIIPLALVPFLARVLRPQMFGLLAFSQSLAISLSVVAEYGFCFSATREVARLRHSPAALQALVARVLGAKILLAALVLTAGLGLLWTVPAFRGHAVFLYGACFLAIAQAATPVWYFQGIERMAQQSAWDALGLALGAVAVLVQVRHPSQAAAVLFWLGSGAAAGALLNHLRMFCSLGFFKPRLVGAWRVLRDDLSMFLLRGSIGLYTSANVFLLGLLVPAAAVADFAGAEKMIRAVLSAYTPTTQAMFPHMTHLMDRDRRRALRLAGWVLTTFMAGALLLLLLALLGAPLLVRVFLGPGYEAAIPLFRCLSLLLPLIGASHVLGLQVMLPLGMDWAMNAAIGGGAVTNVVMMLILVPHFGPLGMAWSVVASEAVVTGAIVIMLLRNYHAIASPEAAAHSAGL